MEFLMPALDFRQRRIPLSSYRLPPGPPKVVRDVLTGSMVVVAPYDRMSWKVRAHEAAIIDKALLDAAADDRLVPYDRHLFMLDSEPNTVIIAYERGHEMVLG
jgi:hypothetical protein